MKRVLFLGVPLLVALVATIAIVAATVAFPSAARDELDAYLNHLSASSPAGAGQVKVLQVVRAPRPWNLGSEAGYPVFGRSQIHEGESPFDGPPATLGSPTWSDQVVTTTGIRKLTIPFPPEELWCVLLSTRDQNRVVLLARHHREPYDTDWVIHEGPIEPLAESSRTLLAAVGCDLHGAP